MTLSRVLDYHTISLVAINNGPKVVMKSISSSLAFSLCLVFFFTTLGSEYNHVRVSAAKEDTQYLQ